MSLDNGVKLSATNFAMSIWLDMLPVVLKSTLKTEKENNKP